MENGNEVCVCVSKEIDMIFMEALGGYLRLSKTIFIWYSIHERSCANIVNMKSKVNNF